jgi:hypothetical protein
MGQISIRVILYFLIIILKFHNLLYNISINKYFFFFVSIKQEWYQGKTFSIDTLLDGQASQLFFSFSCVETKDIFQAYGDRS